MARPQPWSPADATTEINAIANSPNLRLTHSRHALDQMTERDLIASDVMFVLKKGFVLEEPEPSTQAGFFKYCPQSRSPNSASRTVRVVAIPDAGLCWIKVVTVMWVDRP
jgi:Domain of unknown function (DUF4258)